MTLQLSCCSEDLPEVVLPVGDRRLELSGPSVPENIFWMTIEFHRGDDFGSDLWRECYGDIGPGFLTVCYDPVYSLF